MGARIFCYKPNSRKGKDKEGTIAPHSIERKSGILETGGGGGKGRYSLYTKLMERIYLSFGEKGMLHPEGGVCEELKRGGNAGI